MAITRSLAVKVPNRELRFQWTLFEQCPGFFGRNKGKGATEDEVWSISVENCKAHWGYSSSKQEFLWHAGSEVRLFATHFLTVNQSKIGSGCHEVGPR